MNDALFRHIHSNCQNVMNEAAVICEKLGIVLVPKYSNEGGKKVCNKGG